MNPTQDTHRPASHDSPGIHDEPALIERLKKGDSEAFEQLVRAAGGRMLAVARRMMPNEDDARDAVQDAFLSAFKSISKFDERSMLTTWLHRITVNACLMKLRAKRRRPEASIDALFPTFDETGHRRNPGAAWRDHEPDRLESNELRTLVRDKIEELPEIYREVLLLRDIAELDSQQTAQYLGLSIPAVKTRLHRARQALRELLDPFMIAE